MKIGDVKGISEVSLELDEQMGKLQRARETTTCSNIDNAIAHIGFAIDQLEEYFKWAGDDGEPTGEE